MSVTPEGTSSAPTSASYEIKSSQLAGMALMLRSEDLVAVTHDLLAQFGPDGENPEFFDHDLLVLDCSALPGLALPPDFEPLLTALRRCQLKPVALRGVPGRWVEAAAALGLADLPAPVRKATAPHTPAQAMDALQVEQTAMPNSPETPEPPAAATSGVPASAAAHPPVATTMVIDKPLRSGQKVYARGGDLVVLAMVNQGAEVVADGNIHVYAPLRGKAMAGARGNVTARIFSTCLEPELISIAGVYRTSENALPPEIAGKAAQVRLSSDGLENLIIEALKN